MQKLNLYIIFSCSEGLLLILFTVWFVEGSQFDSIAEDVLKQIRLEHGDKHLALCIPAEEQMYWRTHNLEDNYYSPYVCRQVLATVSSVLFLQIGFYGDTSLYYCHENSYINKVFYLTQNT